MSSTSEQPFTKNQLFSLLENDGIDLDADIIRKATTGDSAVMVIIGDEYYDKQKYDKAMAWYQLAVVKNNYAAKNNIGVLYRSGLGVPVDYLVAMEWFIKSAIHNNKHAYGNIGILFDNGQGVSVNKYKALEWYRKCENKPRKIKKLVDEGIQLTKCDANKPIEELIMETENILWSTRRKIKNDLKDENESLKHLKTKLEEESRSKTDRINSLEEDNQIFRARSESMQREIDTRLESIEQYKIKEQITNEKTQSLSQTNHELELKLGAKNSEINYLKNENKLLQSTTKKIKELEKSYQNLKELSEKEIQLKSYEIELTKQKMAFLSKTEKQKRCSLEKENRAMKRELKIVNTVSQRVISPKKNNNNRYQADYDNESDGNDNDTDYDIDCGDNNSDNNNVNYDDHYGDEQLHGRRKIPKT